MPGVFAGMIAGVATVIFLMLSHRDPLRLEPRLRGLLP